MSAVLNFPVSYLDDEYLKQLEQESLASPNGAGPSDEPLPPALRASEIGEIAPVEWLVQDFWTAGDLGLFVGDGGAFKSSAAIHMAAAVAGGYDVFERFRARQAPVLIVSAEDPASVVLMRLAAFLEGQAWKTERVLPNVHVLATPDVNLAEGRWKHHLAEEIARVEPGLVVIDPWFEILGADENSNTEVRPAVKYLRSLTSICGSAILVVHHSGKQSPDKRILDRIRGASALPYAARMIYFFEFRDDGVYVENLKLSRGARLRPFVVGRQIESQGDNRAMWDSARLFYETKQQHIESRGELFVIQQLRLAYPNRKTTAQLRALGSVAMPKYSAQEVSAGIAACHARGIIDFEPGERGSRLWQLLRRSEDEPS